MEATSNEIKPLNSQIVSLARKYAETRDKIRGLEAQVNDLDGEKDLIAAELLKLMQELEIQNFKIDGVGTVFLQTSFYPKVLDEGKMINWLDKNGLTNIAPRMVHKAAFKEMYQERVEKDLPLPPPELVDTHSQTIVKLRGAK